MENVKNDLLRRIKMLEYALRQERFKGLSGTPASSVPPGIASKQASEKGNGTPSPQNEEVAQAAPPSTAPEARTNGNGNGKGQGTSNSSVKLPLGVKDAKGRAKSRAYLQQCLQEIAYLTSPTTLNPIADKIEHEGGGAEVGPPRPRLSLLEHHGLSSEEKGVSGTPMPHTDDPFSRLSVPKPNATAGVGEREAADECADALAAKPDAVLAAAAPVSATSTESSSALPPASAPISAPASAPAPASENAAAVSASASASSTSSVQPPISVPDVQLWKLKNTIQAHFDSVRAVVFDQVGDRLFTASDDCTIKHWNVKTGAEEATPELLTTLRGHQGAVTCLVLSKEQQRLYSGSLDSTVRTWKLSDGEAPSSALVADQSQAVWDLALFPYHGQEDALLATASADGTVKLWWTDSAVPERLHLSWDYFGTQPEESAQAERASLGTLPVPTSVTAIPANLRVCAVSFSNGVVKTFSLETGKELKRLASNVAPGEHSNAHANMVVAHPTLPLVATAQEDSYIHMYDVMTGVCTLSLHAHGDSVSCIDIDPSGLTLVSGSHDCTVRFWDIDNPPAPQDAPEQKQDMPTCSAVCFQEIQPHQVKANEGVLSVVYHPTAPLVATAGADGTVRLFG